MIPDAPLSRATLAEAVTVLAGRDDDLGRVVDRLGPPPLWDRQPGFPTLVHIILEQQVSLASARSAFKRLNSILPSLDPGSFLTLDDRVLRQVGFSGQKTSYCRNLARALRDHTLDIDALPSFTDADAREELIKVKGIGPWTAEIYLLMVLGRPDIWPAGDLALGVAVQDVKHLPSRPAPEGLLDLAEPWRPLRAVAARILWNHYLNPPDR